MGNAHRAFAEMAVLASLLASTAAGAAEIRIGIVAPMTGQLASEGKNMENAVKLAVAALNAKGGLLGNTVTTVTADDACDPQQGAIAGSKLASSDVMAVVGGYGRVARIEGLGAVGPASSRFRRCGRRAGVRMPAYG